MHFEDNNFYNKISCTGFALLEVLLTLLIISLSILGVIGLQLSALHHSQESYLQSLAAVRLSSLMERLRVNASPDARSGELDQWNQTNALLLPNGKGNFYCAGDDCTANLQWGIDKVQSFSLTAKL